MEEFECGETVSLEEIEKRGKMRDLKPIKSTSKFLKKCDNRENIQEAIDKIATIII